jgi:methyltransferase-like protein
MNHPVYFHEFVAHAASAGLQYLASAQVSPREAHLPSQVKESLDRLGTDRLRREQYLDFVLGRTFRPSLLCHAGLPVLAEPSADVVATLRLVALASPESESPDIRSDAEEVFVSPLGGRLRTNRPLVKAALTILAEWWPRSLNLEQLRDEIQGRLGRLQDDPQALARAILHCYRSMLVQLHVHEPAIALEPGERPRAAPLARHQAEGDTLVISLRNRNVELESFDASVLQLLDGTRDRTAVVEQLMRWVAEGTFAIDRSGQPLQDPVQIRAVLTESLEPSLRRLAGHALLWG